MTVVYAVTLGVLALSGLLTVLRMVRGPDALDRIVATDVFIVLLVAGAAVGMAATHDDTAVPLLVVVALLGFISSVTAAHLVEDRDRLP